MSKNITVSVDKESMNLLVKGLRESDLIINYSNDIDFSELMSELTNLIGSEENIDLVTEKQDDTDEKLKIILETMNSIFEKYSDSINLKNDDKDVSLPFS